MLKKQKIATFLIITSVVQATFFYEVSSIELPWVIVSALQLLIGIFIFYNFRIGDYFLRSLSKLLRFSWPGIYFSDYIEQAIDEDSR